MAQSVRILFLYCLCYCYSHLTAGKVFKCAREGKSHPFHLISLFFSFLPSPAENWCLFRRHRKSSGVLASASAALHRKRRRVVSVSRGERALLRWEALASLFFSLLFWIFLISPYYLVVLYIYVLFLEKLSCLSACRIARASVALSMSHVRSFSAFPSSLPLRLLRFH